MIHDIDLFGVFVNGALVTAALALLLQMPLRLLLMASRVYHFVWHPALFDLAFFVVLWGGVSWLVGSSPAVLDALLG